MNQGKLEVVKREMARVNVDILGISELKRTGMGEFHSDDHYIYYCGQESLSRNGLAIMVNKRARNAVLECSLKNNRMISVCFQGKPFKSMPQPGMILWWPPRTNTQKRCPFHYRRLECKSRKSRDTWSYRKVWHWSAKWSRAKANRVLTREGTGYHKYPLPTTQEMTLNMDITRWSILKSDEYILCNQRWGSSIQSAKTRPGADCGSAHELLIAKFRLQLKKVGKTTRPFSYDLNQIPYDYMVEVTNRFKGLDLKDRVSENYGQKFIKLYRRWWPKPS